MMRTHVQRTVAVLRRPTSTIRQIRQLVPRDTLQMLVVALVHSRLDYGNSVLTGIPAYLTRRLHKSVLNAAARLIYQLRSSDHITDALVCLHWLRIPERIEYKIALLSYKVMTGMVPQYLEPLKSVSSTCLADGLCVLQSQIVCQYQLLNCLQSAAERFPFPVLKRGTNYRKKSPL